MEHQLSRGTESLPYSKSPSNQERHRQLRDKSQHLVQLANVLLEFYYCEGPAFLLDLAVEIFESYRKLVVIYDEPRVFMAIAHQADISVAIFELHHDLKALERAIKSYEHLLNHHLLISASANTNQSYISARLAYALICRFRATGDEDDCQRAWGLINEARSETVNDLSYAWITIVTALIQSDTTAWPIVAITSEDLANTLTSLRAARKTRLPRSIITLSFVAESQLANAICHKTQDYEHLHLVIRNTEVALRLFSSTAVVLRYRLLIAKANLHLRAHFGLTEDPSSSRHVAAAVECAHEARLLEGLMTRNAYEKWMSLHQWAAASMQCAVHAKDLDAMERAVDALKEVVFKCPTVKSHRYHAYMINHLALAMGLYFEQSGRIGILDEAMLLMDNFVSKEALQTPFLACNIAALMLYRAQIADPQSARLLLMSAIKLCQARKASPNFAKIIKGEQHDVDMVLIRTSRIQIRAGDEPIVDPESVLQMAQQVSVFISPHENSRRKGLVLAQVDALILKAQRLMDGRPISHGLSLIEKELAIPEMSSSIYVVDLLAAQAELLVAQARFDHDQRSVLLDQAWNRYEAAATATSGRPKERFQACLEWALSAEKQSNVMMAFKAYSYAIEVLPDVVFLGEEVIGRIEALRQVNGLAGSSVAAALTIGDIAMAAEFLERTRGILWLQSFRARDTELAPLPETLRNQYVNLGRELEGADSLHWTTRRHKAQEMRKMVAEIRAFPNLERFQLPPLLHDIQRVLQSKDSYAVIIVPSVNHCDVVILGLDAEHADRCHLRLTTVRINDIRDLSRKLSISCAIPRAGKDEPGESRGISRINMRMPNVSDPVTSLLAQLWGILVKPVIEHLRLQRAPELASRKRVFWCPVGPLSSLPLHAAGVYEGLSQDHLADYVISSYSPTVTALYRLLGDDPILTKDSTATEVLLVAQPTSIGLDSLVNVATEIDLIKTLAPPDHTITLGDGHGSSVEEALDAMGTANVLHLACHGHQDQLNPLDCGFELQDGRLTLGQLIKLNIPDAQLAYLSACDSAGMDEGRPDEGLNLVGAMIFVGFRSVIGTMWAMDDVDGPFMAERIYSRIFKDGTLDLAEVPQAVDIAVRELRESGVPASRWATYVHFGV